ncbi:acyl carrier protein [Bradyrhizobium sp.]|uniref:acyl carrier protein n=1 Tax=Bradyrhizobium sp. TaxID=376 RepID=UPI0040382D86
MDVRGKLTNSFHRVFEIDDLVITDEMTAKDVPGWDSLAHINLIMDVEEEFGLRFTVDDIADLKNVGEMIQMLERKLSLA